MAHGFFAMEGAKAALEAHAVKAADYARDMGLVHVQERLRATVMLPGEVIDHTQTLSAATAGVYFRLRRSRADILIFSKFEISPPKSIP